MADLSAGAAPEAPPPPLTALGAAASARSKSSGRPANDRPVHVETVVIRSDLVQRLAQRDLRAVAEALFSIGVGLGVLGKDDARDEEVGIVHRLFEENAAAIAQIARLNGLTDHGRELPIARYSGPRRVVIPISSPHLAVYVEQIKQLDEMVARMDLLWLTHVVTKSQRAHAFFDWRERMQQMTRAIIDTERRVRAAIKRLGLEREMAVDDARSGERAGIVWLNEGEGG
jgi:hypothetical protein